MKKIGSGRCVKLLYQLNQVAGEDTTTLVNSCIVISTSALWHFRLGHLSPSRSRINVTNIFPFVKFPVSEWDVRHFELVNVGI